MRTRSRDLPQVSLPIDDDKDVHLAFSPVFLYYAFGLSGVVALARAALGWAIDFS
jgi:hypothetical protein